METELATSKELESWIEYLGINIIWMLPIYKCPNKEEKQLVIYNFSSEGTVLN